MAIQPSKLQQNICNVPKGTKDDKLEVQVFDDKGTLRYQEKSQGTPANIRAAAISGQLACVDISPSAAIQSGSGNGSTPRPLPTTETKPVASASTTPNGGVQTQASAGSLSTQATAGPNGLTVTAGSAGTTNPSATASSSTSSGGGSTSATSSGASATATSGTDKSSSSYTDANRSIATTSEAATNANGSVVRSTGVEISDKKADGSATAQIKVAAAAETTKIPLTAIEVKKVQGFIDAGESQKAIDEVAKIAKAKNIDIQNTLNLLPVTNASTEPPKPGERGSNQVEIAKLYNGDYRVISNGIAQTYRGEEAQQLKELLAKEKGYTWDKTGPYAQVMDIPTNQWPRIRSQIKNSGSSTATGGGAPTLSSAASAPVTPYVPTPAQVKDVAKVLNVSENEAKSILRRVNDKFTVNDADFGFGDFTYFNGKLGPAFDLLNQPIPSGGGKTQKLNELTPAEFSKVWSNAGLGEFGTWFEANKANMNFDQQSIGYDYYINTFLAPKQNYEEIAKLFNEGQGTTYTHNGLQNYIQTSNASQLEELARAYKDIYSTDSRNIDFETLLRNFAVYNRTPEFVAKLDSVLASYTEPL